MFMCSVASHICRAHPCWLFKYLLSKGRLEFLTRRIDVVALRSVAAGPAGDAKIKVGAGWEHVWSCISTYSSTLQLIVYKQKQITEILTSLVKLYVKHLSEWNRVIKLQMSWAKTDWGQRRVVFFSFRCSNKHASSYVQIYRYIPEN